MPGPIDPNTDYNAWILVGYIDEATGGSPSYVLGGENEWLQIGDVPNPLFPALDENDVEITDVNDPNYQAPINAGDPTLFDGVRPYLLATNAIDEIRQLEGDFQQQFTDRDVRMEPLKVTYTYPAPITP